MKKLILLFLFILSVLITQAQAKNTVYTGTIKGYSSSMGFKTGTLYLLNVVTGVGETYLIEIAPDGTYMLDFPLNTGKECWISFPFFNGSVYFQPGKKLIHDFDITDVPKVSSRFKGDAETINNEINKVRALFSYNWDSIYSDIHALSPEQYKSYMLGIQSQKLASLDSVRKSEGMSVTSYRLARDKINYSIAAILMNYNDNRESAYRIKNNIGFASRAPVLKRVKLEPGYYDFLRNLRYNNPSAMAVYDYNPFINTLKFLDLIYDKAGRIDYTKEIEELKKRDTSDNNIKRTIDHMVEAMNRNATVPGTVDKARPEVLRELLQTNITLELELMRLQDTCRNINDNKIPLSEDAIARVKAGLKKPYLFPEVLQLNNKVKQVAELSKTQTGYSNNKTPEVAVDSIFDTIIDRYKGKVIFIDFWATWCGPCLDGIKQVAPMKSELADRDVVFLYITNHSSPETAYKVMITGIKGEHYRLTTDEYNVLAKRFQINGIPHYAIANKKGIVVDNDFHFAGPEKLKARLVQLEAE